LEISANTNVIVMNLNLIEI